MERLIELLKTLFYNLSYEEKRELITRLRSIIDKEEEKINEYFWNN